MEDSQPEVRVKAAKVLSGLLHCQFILEPMALLVSFEIILWLVSIVTCFILFFKDKIKHQSRKKKNSLHLKHAAVLGLCAYIQAYPYDVPDFLPDIFNHLRPRLNDPQPIPVSIYVMFLSEVP